MNESTTNAWNVDSTHSSIIFSIRHLVIAKVRGRFNRFEGVLELDEADLTKSKVSIEIEVASVDTSLEQRDGHLRSPEFFDAESFPKATFTSRVIRRNGDAHDVVGDFTLRGTTREITLKATFGGKATDPRGRVRVAFDARTAIDREVYGLTWNQALVDGSFALGSTVELEIELEAIRA